MAVKTYDQACADLAVLFLNDDAPEDTVASLATHIQQAIEDWFAYQELEKSRAAQESAP